MDNNCDYDLKGVDQLDWCKLVGVFYNPFNIHGDTAMVGWRYNLETRRIELNAYYHIDGKRTYTDPLMEVGLLETFTCLLRISTGRHEYEWTLQRASDNFKVVHVQPFRHDRKLSIETNFYFGGNQPAPQEVSCQLENI